MIVPLNWENSTQVSNWEEYIINDFRTEKDMTEYIDSHAKEFARDILEITYKIHKKEFYLGKNKLFNDKNRAHVDFLFISENDENILVECKNPRFTYSEVRNGLIQIMAYYVNCKQYGLKIDRMCLVISKFDRVVSDIIKEFKLPIEIFIFSKTKTLKLFKID